VRRKRQFGTFDAKYTSRPTPAGGDAFLKDLPNAKIYRIDAGHFAVEDHLDFISRHMHEFYEGTVAKSHGK